MKESQIILQRLRNSQKAQTLRAFLAIFFILFLFSYLALNKFSKVYLNGLLRSQDYYIAVQEWRGVANGVLHGWRFLPAAQKLCITQGGQEVYRLDDTSCGATPSDRFGGAIETSFEGISIKIILKWPLVILAFLSSITVLLFAYPLQRLLNKADRTRAEINVVESLLNKNEEAGEVASELRSVIEIQSKEIFKLQKDSLMAEIAKQVAHDIRSPVMALETVKAALADSAPDVNRMLTMSIDRIRNIADDLLNRDRDLQSTSDFPVIEVLNWIESVVLEKKALLPHGVRIEIQSDLKEAQRRCAVSKTEFDRILSNLINNSIEAMDGQGELLIIVTSSNSHLVVQVKDSGRGIPSEIVSKLGSKGFTYGKEASKQSGSGLGLYHALETIKFWKGDMEIQSKLGYGTTISLIIPFKT